MNFEFHPEAEIEFNKAIDYYSEIEEELGYDFAIEGDIRRSLVKRFPYGVLYSEENNGIFILAIMNLHRHPDYWKHRN
ncbi:MAG: type II toxin-antitoxin system RelE/ParE family toxin [Gammaproteobacteria bacterium]|nr:MAG: type II toxin-antitoxin system RelE/ParE family toxin [Gammaproteobacteria bacterium]